MQFCPLCKVSVAGHKRCCPLCGGELSGVPEPETEVFPALPRHRFSARFLLCALALLAIAVSAICMMVNIATGARVWWSMIVAAGAACGWFTAFVAISHRRDMTQNLAWQVLLITILAVFWDRGTGWRGWSINYVFPCACGAGLICIMILIIILRLPVRAYASTLIFCSLLGLLPALLVFRGLTSVALPSLICSGLSIFILCALLLFFWTTVKSELHRRFHI